MSLFKCRDLWTTTVGDGEEFDQGCLCVANLDNSKDGSDKVIVGSFHGYLRIYSVKRNEEVLLLDLHVGQPILQLASGKLVSATDSVHLAVLQPRRLQVYTFQSSLGRAEHGNQHQLRMVYEHHLQRTAFCMCVGPFGGVQGKDFLCVQSMDCTLSVFEQEAFAFSRFLPDSLMPGPVVYVSRTDSLVTVSSSRHLESYKYQALATATDAKDKKEAQNIKTGKKVGADWRLNLGECVLDLSLCSNTLHVLGERSYFCVSDLGELRHVLKLPDRPNCFLPYLTPTGSEYCMVWCKCLLVYQGTRVAWAASGPNPAIVQLSLANIGDLRGVIVWLGDGGQLGTLYLGSSPNNLILPINAEVRNINYAELDKELKQLNRKAKDTTSKHQVLLPTTQEDEVSIQLLEMPTIDRRAKHSRLEDEEGIPSAQVKVRLSTRTHVHDVRLSTVLPAALDSEEDTLFYHSLEPSHPVEVMFVVHLGRRFLTSDLTMVVTVTYLTDASASRCVSLPVRLPLGVVLKPSLPVKNAAYKLTLDTNKATVALNTLFPDLVDSTMSNPHAVGFQFYGVDVVVTVLASKTSQRYRLQSESFEGLALILLELAKRLESHFSSQRDLRLSYSESMPLQEYFMTIDRHFDCRQTGVELKSILECRAQMFRAIQKRLLIRFKDKSPTPLANMDTLLENTAKHIFLLADHLDECQVQLQAASANLSAATRLINFLLKLTFKMNDLEFSVLEHAISPIVNDEAEQGWEESVDMSLTHLLRTCLAKSATDQVVNPSALSEFKDTQKLKKHLNIVYERLGKGATLSVPGATLPISTAVSEAPLPKSSPSSSTAPRLEELGTFYRSESGAGYQRSDSTLSTGVPAGSKFSSPTYKASRDLNLPSLAVRSEDPLPGLDQPLPRLDPRTKYASVDIPDLGELEGGSDLDQDMAGLGL